VTDDDNQGRVAKNATRPDPVTGQAVRSGSAERFHERQYSTDHAEGQVGPLVQPPAAAIGDVPPVEFEATYYALESPVLAGAVQPGELYETRGDSCLVADS
jgi:hypothetical protein